MASFLESTESDDLPEYVSAYLKMNQAPHDMRCRKRPRHDPNESRPAFQTVFTELTLPEGEIPVKPQTPQDLTSLSKLLKYLADEYGYKFSPKFLFRLSRLTLFYSDTKNDPMNDRLNKAAQQEFQTIIKAPERWRATFNDFQMNAYAADRQIAQLMEDVLLTSLSQTRITNHNPNPMIYDWSRMTRDEAQDVFTLMDKHYWSFEYIRNKLLKEAQSQQLNVLAKRLEDQANWAYDWAGYSLDWALNNFKNFRTEDYSQWKSPKVRRIDPS